MKTRKDTDYLYASARLHAIEARELTPERLLQLADSQSREEIFRVLSDAGYARTEGDGADDGAMLDRALLAAFDLIAEIAPDPGEFDLFRYPTDVHNLKSVLKCEARGTAPEGLLRAGGTVSPDAAVQCGKTQDYAPYPEAMRHTAPLAWEAFKKTGDPQCIDLLLDRACFADMRDAADASHAPEISTLVSSRADLVNISAYVRTVRMGKPYAFFKEVMVPGGTLPEALFAQCREGGVERLFARLWLTGYDRLAAPFRTDAQAATSAAVERACDEEYLRRIAQVRREPFGRGVLVGYLCGKEYEVKNVRILLAGKRCGLAADVIRERMRGSGGNI